MGRIADDLLRVVLAAHSGTLPHRGIRDRDGAGRRLDVALRAALLCQLAQSGRLSGKHTAELSAPPTRHRGDPRGPTGDPILETLAHTIGEHPGRSWVRWCASARSDRPALIAQSVREGRLQPPDRHPSHGPHRYADADPAGAHHLRARTFTVSELIVAPTDDREAVLGFLFAVCGPTMSADRVLGWDVRLSHLRADQGAPTVRAVLVAARTAARSPLRRR